MQMTRTQPDEFDRLNSDRGGFLPREPWTAPHLVRHGTVADLTQKAHTGPDGVKSRGVTSDRDQKRALAPVDVAAVLRSLGALDIQTWNYNDEPEHVRHMGPTAQDFADAFGLGANDREIKVVDGIGVALAAIQALAAEVVDLRERMAALEARVRDARTSLV